MFPTLSFGCPYYCWLIPPITWECSNRRICYSHVSRHSPCLGYFSFITLSSPMSYSTRSREMHEGFWSAVSPGRAWLWNGANHRNFIVERWRRQQIDSRGGEIARTECGKYGKTSRNVFNQKIDYASAEVSTRYGISGVKVWISYSKKKGGRAISETYEI